MKELRVIITHTGLEEGFIPNVLAMHCKTDTNDGDYHNEMYKNNYFKKWKKNYYWTVLVVDNIRTIALHGAQGMSQFE